MKQHITADQIRELTPEQQRKLKEWWRPKEGDWWKPTAVDEPQLLRDHEKECCLREHCNFDSFESWCENLKRFDGIFPLLSISQCLELLDDLTIESNPDNQAIRFKIDRHMWLGNSKLLDELWEAVKAVL